MERRKPENQLIISQEQFLRVLKVEGIPLRTRALMSLIYLTGARISEVLPLKKENIYKEWPHWNFSMKVLKRKKLIMRSALIRISEENQVFLDYIFNYINSHNSEYLFPSSQGGHIKRIWGWTLINKVFAWPHFLRHLRCTHLAQKGLSAF
ncbi:unnamed protein product, partial [marine sediment metagenome]